MQNDVTIAIPFARVEPDQNPNIRDSCSDALQAYFRSMTVAFASSRKFNPAANLELITNDEPPAEFTEILRHLGVKTRIIAFEHKPAPGFTNNFGASLFLLDALENMQSQINVLMDPDVLLIKPIDGLLADLNGRVGAVEIDYSADQNINGLSRREASGLHSLLGEQRHEPTHMGGEFYVIPCQHVELLRQRVARAWDLSVERSDNGLSRFTTEEHILSYAIVGVPFTALNRHVRRIWTAHSFRTVTKYDSLLTAWHLPAEKDRGFSHMYHLVLDRDSWFWQADEAVFAARAARVMGMHHRSPKHLALDAIGPALRWLRELRTPKSERVAG